MFQHGGQAAQQLLFPRLGGALIDSPQNYDNTTYQTQFSRLDWALLAMYRGWTGGSGQSPATIVAQIKARNPHILLGNYTRADSVLTSGSAESDMRTKLAAEHGPSGIGDWYAYDNTGTILSDFAGTNDCNLTLNTTADSNGDHYPQWLAKRDWTSQVSVAPFDVWMNDDNFFIPRVTADWDRSGTNRGPTDATAQNWWRDGQAAYYDTANSVRRSTVVLLANADNDLTGAVYPGSGNGISPLPFTQYKGKLGGAILEGLTGETWSVETWGGWAAMMNWYHTTFKNLNSPQMIVFNAHVYSTDYQGLRYAFASCCMDNGYFNASSASDTLGPPGGGSATGADYHTVNWFDEYDLNGTASTKWLGAPIDPPQSAAYSLGVYVRRFKGGMALCNPKGNGPRTITPPGGGYTHFTGTQDATTNNGAAVTSTVTLADRDGLFLVAT